MLFLHAYLYTMCVVPIKAEGYDALKPELDSCEPPLGAVN